MIVKLSPQPNPDWCAHCSYYGMKRDIFWFDQVTGKEGPDYVYLITHEEIHVLLYRLVGRKACDQLDNTYDWGFGL